MKPTIKSVRTRSELRRFASFPNKLYKGSKFFVPVMVSMEMATFNPKTNHAHEFCDSALWLALDARGNMVGRIAAIINRAYNEAKGMKQGRIGWLDFIDDPDVSAALLETAENWCRERGMTQICGPMGFLEFDAAGIIVEGYDETPTAYGKYNYPYYAGHMLSNGYVKDTDWVEYQVLIGDTLPDNIAKAAGIIYGRYGLQRIKLHKKKDLVPYFDQIFALLNKAYKDLHGFSELSEGQIEDLKSQFLPNLNMDLISIIADKDGKIVAFGITLPSLSKAMQKARGHMLPFGWAYLLHALRHNDTLDCLLIAVDDDYRSKGVTAVIFNDLFVSAKEFGIKYIETTRELEDNFNVQNLWKNFERRLHKRARCFIKDL